MAIDVAALYKACGPMVIRRCRKILKNEDDALDAVHDVFLKLLKEEERLNGQFPSSLLYTMATNVCLNRLRKKKWEAPISWGSRVSCVNADADESERLFFCTDGAFEQVEAEILIEEILKDESEMNRAIYFMYHVDDMTLKEIGETVGLSFSGVRKRLTAFKSRALLKFELSETEVISVEDAV